MKNSKRIYILLLVLALLILTPISISLFTRYTIKKLVVGDIPDSNAINFNEVLSNEFVEPHISARITGKIRSDFTIQPQYRDGVGSLEISHDTLWLIIYIGKLEKNPKVTYDSPVIISNSKESNLGRYRISKDTYLDGYEGWQYFNKINNINCINTKTIFSLCGTGLIEKEGGAMLNVTCSYKTENNNVNECDEIMKTIGIEVIN